MTDASRYGPWALIAGGSEGLAVAFARRLADAGVNLVLVARRPGPLEALGREIRASRGVEVRTLSLDLKRADMLDQLRAITDDLEIGLLVFNAGEVDGVMGPFLDRDLEDVLAGVRLTTIGQTTLAHHFGSRMAARGRGGIILAGSLSGSAGMPHQATYAAAKAYSQILAEALWCELRPRGVDVLSLVLGVVDTPARTRSGLPDAPGLPVLNADVVAGEALDSLPDGGPVYVPEAVAPTFQYLSSAPRRQIAERMLAVTSQGGGRS